jgi:acetylserotonin O-methyltransferase
MSDTVSPASRPEIAGIIELIDGFKASKAMFTAVSLGIFDRLHQTSATCAELAGDLGCAEHALERLLGFCVAKDLLQQDEGGRWSNTAASERYLRIESPDTLAGYVLCADRMQFRLWAHLEDAVREGTNRWEQEFGRKDGVFDHFFKTNEDKEIFLRGMDGFGRISSPLAVAAFDLSRYSRMVDLGGATGHLVIAACRRYPQMTACVFDLPAVTPVARRAIAEAGLANRIGTVDGDFFKDDLPDADIYGFGRILHDWSDEQVRFLLKKTYDSLPAGGAVMICEHILNERKDGPATALLQSMNMLVVAEGRERSATEYEALVREAGFSSFQLQVTGGPVDAMLAGK